MVLGDLYGLSAVIPIKVFQQEPTDKVDVRISNVEETCKKKMVTKS